MSLQTEASRSPLSERRPVRAALLALALVSAASLSSGCGLVNSGSCVYGSTAYFCSGSTEGECQDDYCDGYWEDCAYYDSMSCDELGFEEGSTTLTNYSPPAGADWTYGGFSGGSAGGGGTSGGGSTSAEGACAYYDNTLNRVLCDPYASSSSCKGKYFGVGTSCQGINCTSSTNPQSCTIPGGGGSTGGGTGGGTGGSCSSAWVCQYDAQSATMCSWACTLSGTERTQTCQVLASMVTSGNAGECCTSCR